MRILSLVAVLAGLCFSALNVPLTVKDGAGAGDIAQYPVKVSVPLPSGAYEMTSRFRVVDNAGNTVPAQFDVLARWWPRNSGIRFVLVHFMADVSSNGRTRYFLRDDGAGNAAAGIAVTEDQGRYYVDAGKVKFEVRKTGFNIIDRLWYDVNNSNSFETSEEMIKAGDNNGAVLTDTQSVISRDTAKTGLKFTMEESGPVRMVLKVESATDTASNGWGFIVRIQAYYNQPFVVLDYYLKNSMHGPTGHHVYFSKFALVNGFSGLGSATVRLGGSLTDNTGAFEGALGASNIASQSTAWNAYTVNGSAKTGLGVGYADISDNEKGVMAVVRKYSYLWPTGLSVTADKKLSVDLWPQGSHRMLDETRRSHQVMLYFHAGSATQADLFKQAKIFQQYPVVALQPIWYATTRAFGDLGGVGWPSDTGWNEALYLPSNNYTGTGEYLATGWWNWGGDPGRRNSSGGGSWPPYLSLWVPCGSPAYFYHSDDAARHIAEMRPMWMDDFKYAEDNWMVKIEYPPASGLRAPNAGLDSSTWTSWDYEHLWIYEMAEYYFMSGERFCQDYLKMQADFTMLSNWDASIADTMVWPYQSFTRSHGESMHAIVDAYKLTGEERYWKIIMAYAQYLADNARSSFGIFESCPFGSSFIVSSAADIYFLMPENTPEERVLKERLFQVFSSNTCGQAYWGSNSAEDNPRAWGQCYRYRADSVYVRPTPADISGGFYYVSYCANGLGLLYFMTGDTAFRAVIGRSNPSGASLNPPQNFMQAQVGSAPASYYRTASAAWYCPDQKVSVRPPAVTDLSVSAAPGGRATLQWTSPGGDAYRIWWSDKPIVQRYGRIAPLDSGDILLPYPDTVASVTNIYRAMPLDASFTPKASGNAEIFTTCALPASLNGRNVYFVVQALDVVSETDQSRGPLSNLDSTVLDTGGSGACAAFTAERIIRKVHAMNSGEFLVTLNEPLRSVPATLGISLSHAVTHAPLAVSSVELDTGCGNLLRVRTTGLVEGQQYRLSLDSAQNVFYFLANFRPNVFSERKIHFGNSYHGDGYEVGHRWDGDYGFNTYTWNSVAWYDWDPASITDSSLRGCIGLNYVPFGSEWFKITVSREVQDYKLCAYVNRDSPCRLQAEELMVWDTSKHPVGNILRTDSLPITIRDGRLDMLWEHLTYVHLHPVFKYFKSVLFNDIAVEKGGNGPIAKAFLMNCPNPFNPSTRIVFSTGRMDRGGKVRLAVYNLSGQLVRDLSPAGVRPGQVCSVEWDGSDRAGKRAASGVYYARLTTGRKTLNLKMVMLK